MSTTQGDSGPVRSGRRLVLFAVAVGVALSAAASLTARQAWRSLYTPPPDHVQLNGQAVWPDQTRRPPALGLPDQNGRVFNLSAQAGKVVVVTFMDSACTTLCPLEAHQLAAVRAQLPRNAPVELVVVSTDPAGDTPSSVRAFAARSGWNGRWQWHWLVASPQRLAHVWHAYGVSVTSSLQHTSVLYLVGRDGYERAGIGVPVFQQEVVTDLRRLAAA